MEMEWKQNYVLRYESVEYLFRKGTFYCVSGKLCTIIVKIQHLIPCIKEENFAFDVKLQFDILAQIF